MKMDLVQRCYFARALWVKRRSEIVTSIDDPGPLRAAS